MIYKIEDIAEEIHSDLNLDIAVGAVAFWIKNNIGKLNNLIFTSFEITDADGQISPAINAEEVVILKHLYQIYNYDYVIRTSLGASAFSAATEIVENGNRIRLVNRTELGKVYSDLRRQTSEELDRLVNGYLLKKSGTAPVAVNGVDGSLPNETFFTNDEYNRNYV